VSSISDLRWPNSNHCGAQTPSSFCLRCLCRTSCIAFAVTTRWACRSVALATSLSRSVLLLRSESTGMLRYVPNKRCLRKNSWIFRFYTNSSMKLISARSGASWLSWTMDLNHKVSSFLVRQIFDSDHGYRLSIPRCSLVLGGIKRIQLLVF
jgi:hypothetical protein